MNPMEAIMTMTMTMTITMTAAMFIGYGPGHGRGHGHVHWRGHGDDILSNILIYRFCLMPLPTYTICVLGSIGLL